MNQIITTLGKFRTVRQDRTSEGIKSYRYIIEMFHNNEWVNITSWKYEFSITRDAELLASVLKLMIWYFNQSEEKAKIA